MVRTIQATDAIIMPRMRFACRIPKATKTHTEFLILTAFRLQQWLHERPFTIRLYVRFLPRS